MTLTPELRDLLRQVFTRPVVLDQLDASDEAVRVALASRLVRRLGAHLHLTGLGRQALTTMEAA